MSCVIMSVRSAGQETGSALKWVLYKDLKEYGYS